MATAKVETETEVAVVAAKVLVRAEEEVAGEEALAHRPDPVAAIFVTAATMLPSQAAWWFCLFETCRREYDNKSHEAHVCAKYPNSTVPTSTVTAKQAVCEREASP